MADLVDVDGKPLRQPKTTKRRRQTSNMKKTLPQGDVLFNLTVDAPEGVSADTLRHLMVEYFGIGYEAFRSKT